MLPNENSGVSISSSTSPLKDVKRQNNRLEYTVSASGNQVVLWSKEHGKPVVKDSENIEMKVAVGAENYRVNLNVKKANTKVVIQSHD